MQNSEAHFSFGMSIK